MFDNCIELTDFHSHILPCIDDGSESVDMSVEMLTLLKSQGVDKVVLTPHYYRDGSVLEFCSARDEAYNALNAHISDCGADVPELIKAAEVKLYPGLWKNEDLGMLCVEGTKVILVELPYEKLSGWMFNEVYALCTKGYLPVLAHIERYYPKYASKDEILKKLLTMSVMAQCNAESFRDFRRKRLIDKIICSGKLAAIGSDCHDVSERKPNFDTAVNAVMKKYGPRCLDDISRMSSILVKGDIYRLI